MKEITNESNRYAKQVMGDEMSANGKGVEGFLGISHPHDHEPPSIPGRLLETRLIALLRPDC